MVQKSKELVKWHCLIDLLPSFAKNTKSQLLVLWWFNHPIKEQGIVVAGYLFIGHITGCCILGMTYCTTS
jgi:hypothetical protein